MAAKTAYTRGHQHSAHEDQVVIVDNYYKLMNSSPTLSIILCPITEASVVGQVASMATKAKGDDNSEERTHRLSSKYKCAFYLLATAAVFIIYEKETGV